ncbi:unnamed protein product, partial [Laminaria digitata]
LECVRAPAHQATLLVVCNNSRRAFPESNGQGHGFATSCGSSVLTLGSERFFYFCPSVRPSVRLPLRVCAGDIVVKKYRVHLALLQTRPVQGSHRPISFARNDLM